MILKSQKRIAFQNLFFRINCILITILYINPKLSLFNLEIESRNLKEININTYNIKITNKK